MKRREELTKIEKLMEIEDKVDQHNDSIDFVYKDFVKKHAET